MKKSIFAFVLALMSQAEAAEFGPAIVWTIVIVPSPPMAELNVLGVYNSEAECNAVGPKRVGEYASAFPNGPVTFRCNEVRRRLK